MSCLFESCQIGPCQLKNRFVRSATGESRADKNGVIKDEILPLYEELSAGGVGLIITGHMYVHPDWKCSPRQTGIWSDDHVDGLRRLARASRRNGAKAVAQINYAGRRPADMTPAEIGAATDAFLAAARRAEMAGFDGVQLHAAHGYLLSCFLTPSENARTDAFGASAQGRRKLLVDIARQTRETLAPGTALLCKLGAIDGRDNSLPLEESVETAVALEQAGVEAIEVSTTLAGDFAQPAATDIDRPAREAYFSEQAAAVKRAVTIPLILVGGLRSLAVMEEAVNEGVCDLVSLCRPFIREPGLVNALRDGRTDRAACISCNKCYSPRGFHCTFA